MKSRGMVPIADLQRRAPEAGRIRMGTSTPGSRGTKKPQALRTFKFTSAAKELIEQIAELYGGEVIPWDQREGQWAVTSDVSEIPVVLMPDGLSTHYELWSGGGCVRRCDGVWCEITKRTGDDDYEKVEVGCLCNAEETDECAPYTRLQVLIPALAFAGTWRIESHGWNAAQELPGMNDMIVNLAEGQYIQAVLGFAVREKTTPAGKRKFVVPYLRVEQTLPELLAGQAGMAALSASAGAVATPALGTGQVSVTDAFPDAAELQEKAESLGWDDPPDDGITDGVVVDDELLELEGKLRADAKNFGLPEDAYVEAVVNQVEHDKVRLKACIDGVRGGTLMPLSIAGGKVQWGRPRQ